MKCITTGLCPQINAAKATLDSAKATKVEKDAAVTAIKDECDIFEMSAAQRMTDCQCAAKKAHDQAWEAVTSGSAEYEKSWKTAEQLLCVLNKVVTCATTPTPTVESITLAAGVADAVCPDRRVSNGAVPSGPTDALTVPASSKVGLGLCIPEGIRVYNGNGDNDGTPLERKNRCAIACKNKKTPIAFGPWSSRGDAVGFGLPTREAEQGTYPVGRCYCQHEKWASCTRKYEYNVYEYDLPVETYTSI